jgi:Fic-DOC domain mobile mystery protein B
MKPEDPGDGQTPVDPDEAEGLLPSHLETRGELDEWEQNNIAEGVVWLSRRRGSSTLSMESLRELHRRMFGKTWKWAGTFRTTGKTIGLPASQLAEAVKNLIENTKHQLETGLLETDEIAMRFHHELVRIHPFANGNGRHARLMTDQLLKERGHQPFTWGSAKLDVAGEARSAYITALRQADGGSYDALRRFVRS